MNAKSQAIRTISARLRPLVETHGPIPVERIDAILEKNGIQAWRRRSEVISRARLTLVDGLVTLPADPTFEVIQGDALDVMVGLEDESFDVVLTDPPYSSGATREAGKTWHTSVKRMARNKDKRWFGGDSMSTPAMLWWLRMCAQQWFRVLKPGGHVLCFIDWRMAPIVADAIGAAIESADLRRCGLIVWDKAHFHMGEFYRNQHELILHFSRGQVGDPRVRNVGNVLRHPIVLRGIHPTEKPVPLLRDLLRPCAGLGSRVLDPFGGSCSTGEAALREGASVVLIERETQYAEAGRQRLAGVLAERPWEQQP